MERYKIVRDPVCGYSRLDPIPSQEETLEFYRKKYFGLIEAGERAPEIQRQRIGGEEARSELEWLSQTLYSDILYVLNNRIRKKSKHLLDIGSGTAAFLKHMINAGWNAVGIEPSEEGTQMTTNSGIVVYNTSLEDFVTANPNFKGTFDAITLLNVLEHVPNPAEILLTAKRLLNPYRGLICIRVPNDFTELQACAEKKLNKTQWWVATPDHINYFGFESLQKLVDSVGLETIYKTTDFPMELFLLMGDDYVDNPGIGSLCHRKRVSFELAIPDTLRREIYHSLAKIRVGRSCIIFVRIKSRKVLGGWR